MTPDEMLELFRLHRDADAQRDYDTILDTFAEDCYLATAALGTRSEGRTATRAAYVAYFTTFPDCEQAGVPSDEIRAAAKACRPPASTP